ncbi:lysine N(6)-hydroxylase/L-ornithine N(5)-oxygenase family protein [Streptomyces spiramenti]|uniref:L-lysine N6-monooxygenase MbtG n=1 Tax=Streptomyces spiramenti TaxID=2720606 RepID=A0ABX1AS28_9ACTN|nr:SidA/IucD/PvdA family monooxygenase [Streptomyces spiramenti]NJP68233.1 SidA/IucD/PvdA family monooxygenase [Streptomyces spiramenti]
MSRPAPETPDAPDASRAPGPAAVHDVIAVGCGPFNLGLAALASTVDDLDLVVLEETAELHWHRGMMFDDASMQVNFLADLVTLVAPTHPLSFLAYLHDRDRLYPFTVRENFFPSRVEYEDYLRWAAARLPSVRFSHRVLAVRRDPASGLFVTEVERADGTRLRLAARHLVVGTGTAPHLPDALTELPEERLLHTGEFLHRGADLDTADHVTVVGSGQSGAEVVIQLLERNLAGGPAVSWLSRTPSFAPLDYTRLVLEMTTPDYMRYFHGLPEATRDRLLAEQWQLYKGVSADTLAAVHELLYRRQLRHGLRPVELRPGVSVLSAATDAGTGTDGGTAPDGAPATAGVLLTCRHRDTGRTFEHRTDLVVAATGYRARTPAFLAALEPLIRRDAAGRPVVGADHAVALDTGGAGKLFLAGTELHSHGASAPNLDIGAIRNATILNAVTGREVYRLPKTTAFTDFAPPPAAPADSLPGTGTAADV